MIDLRSATAADAPALVALMKSIAQEGRWVRTQWPFDEAERARRFAASLESGRARCIVAERDGRVIGQLTLFPDGPIADLGIFVDGRARRSGIGTALLAAGTELAIAHDVEELHLEVYAHNLAALALYRRAGFERFGETYPETRRSGKIFDVVRMRKKLPRRQNCVDS
jgi:L-phenylalanine/L-methionine N-acetyltransferase